MIARGRSRRTIKFRQRGEVVVAGLQFRNPRLRQRDVGVEHVELRPRSRREAFPGEPERLPRLLDVLGLAEHGLPRLVEIRPRLLHLQIDPGNGVVILNARLFQPRARLLDPAVRLEAVEEVPASLHAEEPAVHDIRDRVGNAVVLDDIPGVRLHGRLVPRFLQDDPLRFDEDILPLRLERGPPRARLLQRLAQREADGRRGQGAEELEGLLPGRERAGFVAERPGELKLCDPAVVARLDQGRERVGKGHLRLEDIEARHRARLVTRPLVGDLCGEQIDRLLLHGNQRPVEHAEVKLLAHRRDHLVHRVAQ